jgi:hypothetical protein
LSTYQAPAPPVDKDVHGHLVGVEMRQAGWHRFLIQEPGRQYPLKADTKVPEIVEQAMSLMNQQVSAQIREQTSETINPHSGQPYVNRYLNQIAAQGFVPTTQGQPQPTQGQPQAAQVQPAISGYDKDLNIMRQCASKCAVAMIGALPEEQRTIPGLIAAAETWVSYYVYGPLRFGLQPFSSPDGQEMPVGAPESAPPGLEDTSQAPCPDCGFVGTHAIGCPRGGYV